MRQYPQGRKDLVAYANTLVCSPGDAVQLMVGAHYQGHYEADLVRVVCGDNRPRGTGLDVRPVADQCRGRYPARAQAIFGGSCALASSLPEFQSLSISFKIFPTTPEQPCTVLSAAGLQLMVRAGKLELIVHGQRRLVSEQFLRQRRWHEVAVAVNGAGLVSLWLRGQGIGSAEPVQLWSELQHTKSDGPLVVAAGDWWLARTGAGEAAQFNGRLEDLRVFNAAHLPECDGDAFSAPLFEPLPSALPETLVAAWDFSTQMSAQSIPDHSGQYRLQLQQHPTRAVKGSRWDGSVQDWRDAPQQYAAIHFHEDDLTDAGWQVDFEWTLPVDLASGVYAVRLQPQPDASEDEAIERVTEYVPLFVRPAPGAQRAPIAMLMSTATYLAYGNQRLAAAGVLGDKLVRNPNDLYLLDHPEVGLSHYEHHRDGSGVHYASANRPLLNLCPGSIMWSFNADTNLLAWLEATDQAFDVITDHDLHTQGAAALAPYRVVITGTHPEYHSTAMLDGLTHWLEDGGRLMYMGGNGFYWRIAFDPADSGVIEVRRAEDGTRAWIAQPGEYHHSFNGEYGGLWRRLGRPPNTLVGVGFAAQGFDGGTYYRWKAAAEDPRVAFMVEGLNTRGKFGDFGTQGGGAAGEEIDRFDFLQGSPNHALVLASSEAHRPGMLLAKEEYLMMEPPQEDARIRADLTFFETPAGGAVFATGSISYAGALSVDGYDNEVATLTGNVLHRFIDPTPFEYPV